MGRGRSPSVRQRTLPDRAVTRSHGLHGREGTHRGRDALGWDTPGWGNLKWNTLGWNTPGWDVL